MTYFYWFILKASVDSSDSNTKPSIDLFSPLRKQWQYLEHTGRWSVQIESSIIPSEAVDLFHGLTAMSRSWINGALLVNGVAVGGPWDVEAFPAFVEGYALTYAQTELIPLHH